MRVHVNSYWDDQRSRDYLEIQKFVNDLLKQLINEK